MGAIAPCDDYYSDIQLIPFILYLYLTVFFWTQAALSGSLCTAFPIFVPPYLLSRALQWLMLNFAHSNVTAWPFFCVLPSIRDARETILWVSWRRVLGHLCAWWKHWIKIDWLPIQELPMVYIWGVLSKKQFSKVLYQTLVVSIDSYRYDP